MSVEPVPPTNLSELVRQTHEMLVARALKHLLLKVCNHVGLQWDQQLRHEFGDELAEVMIAQLKKAMEK